MKFYFSVIITLLLISSFTVQSQVPQVTPSSPEAYKMAQAANIPVDQSTGQMSYTVPIYNIEIDGNNWPIGLQYNYGGFMPASKPSLTGLGWSLNAYGSVTREIRGIADFKPKGYYGGLSLNSTQPSYVENLINLYIKPNNYENVYNMPYGDFMGFSEGILDSEPDKYTVNIGGKSFSFKIKRDQYNNYAYTAHFLSVHYYKVDIIMEAHPISHIDSFIVTDDKGIKYVFNGSDAEGITITDSNVQDQHDNKTAWFLSKIEYLNGEEISFNYDQEEWFTWNFRASASTWEGTYTTPDFNNQTHQVIAGGYSDENRDYQMDRQILKSITFPKGRLEFNTEVVVNGSSTYKRYKSIVLQNTLIPGFTDNNITSYEIDYFGNRDVLTEIRKNDDFYLGFHYNKQEFSIPGFYRDPSNKPLDQDYYGFYNGAYNTEVINTPVNNGNADRSINFSETLKGALDEITHATGGTTSIFYEQNNVKVPYGDSNGSGNDPFNRSINLNLNSTPTNNNRHTEQTVTFDFPVRANLFHNLTGSVEHGNSIYMGIQKLSGPAESIYDLDCYAGTPINHWYYPLVISDRRNSMIPPNPSDPKPCDPFYPNPILSPSLIFSKDPDNNCPYPVNHEFYGCTGETTINHSGSSGGDFWIMPGTYRFYISNHINGDPSRPAYMNYGQLNGSISLDYYMPENTDESGEYYVNDAVGGIRVKNIIERAENGNATSIIDYNYYDDYGYSTGVENVVPHYADSFHYNIVYPGGIYDEFTTTHYYLNSFNSKFGNLGIPIYYQQVRKRVYDSFENLNIDDEEENGGLTAVDENGNPLVHANYSFDASFNGYIETKYETPASVETITYPKLPLSRDIYGSKMIQEQIFDSNSANTKSTSNSYSERRHDTWPDQLFPQLLRQDYRDDHPIGFKIYGKQIRNVDFDTKCYNPNSGDCHPHIMRLHDFIRYKELEFKWFQDETITIQNGVETITTTNTEDEADSFHLYPRSISTQNSSGEYQRQEFLYPKDIDDPLYNAMETRNQNSTPVVVKNYLNDLKLSEIKSNFEILNNSGYLVTSQHSKLKDASNFQEEFNLKYDFEGNIIETQNKQNIKTAYIWGYHREYPIAKIVNISYNEILSFISPIQNASNEDDDNDMGYSGNEGYLRQLLDNLRNNSILENSQMISYTYDPLIGITSQTDPRGYTVYYEYDDLNRLEFVKDADGNLLSENKYNYRTND